MPIIYDKEKKIYNIKTANTSYIIVIYKNKYLINLYYGKRIDEFSIDLDNFPVKMQAFSADDVDNDGLSTDVLPMEYPCYGSADLRTPAFHAEYENGSSVTKLEYESYEIFDGKKLLLGLPATYVEDKTDAQTLEITLCDKMTGLKVILSYTTFDNFDAIAKSIKVVNCGTKKINIKSVLSSTIHLFDKNYDFVHLEGAWARERNIQKRPLMNGIMQIDSKRVSSGHFHSPFLALARPNATETEGEVYGFSFVYSGNHIEQVEVNPFDTVRVNIGINPFGFNWILMPRDEFQAPEVILTYSDNGFGKMSRTYHDLYRTCLVRGKYRDEDRPILINNWEATYFDFNEEKILNIAKKAKSVGVELMVLDDGWFGKRNREDCSLGDWVVDKNKLPNGIEGLAKKVEALGMKFGLWFEPEMISPDSDLYRNHPEWCIHIEEREKTLSRNQLVLDLSRADVRDYVVDIVSNILKSAPISYVKWDYNRNITEIGSAKLPPERQQELPHRYILGLYEILERITSAFPNVLFEGCSGGGGRFDAGMLYYFPQHWTSDNTDALERMYIQYGTSMVMPSSAMGAHISAVPNHQTGRMTPLEMRGNIAMAGQLGYELDLNSLTDSELEIVKEQIKKYKKIRKTVHQGKMFRLKSPFEENCCAWEFADNGTVVLIYCTTFTKCSVGKICIKLQGLEESVKYINKEAGKIYSGRYLMNVGLYFENSKDFESRVIVLQKQNEISTEITNEF
ncbi:MAG: alpha-galactosidase [Firmicutes bacterium]|nr:alpha-galactosidase [Bacillota bacterium]